MTFGVWRSTGLASKLKSYQPRSRRFWQRDIIRVVKSLGIFRNRNFGIQSVILIGQVSCFSGGFSELKKVTQTSHLTEIFRDAVDWLKKSFRQFRFGKIPRDLTTLNIFLFLLNHSLICLYDTHIRTFSAFRNKV